MQELRIGVPNSMRGDQTVALASTCHKGVTCVGRHQGRGVRCTGQPYLWFPSRRLAFLRLRA